MHDGCDEVNAHNANLSAIICFLIFNTFKNVRCYFIKHTISHNIQLILHVCYGKFDDIHSISERNKYSQIK